MDLAVSSGDILTGSGPHGIAVFRQANSTLKPITPLAAISYGTVDDGTLDPKGVGGELDIYSAPLGPLCEDLLIVTCPADITLECGDDSTPSNTGTATATNDCDCTITITFSDSVAPSTCDNEEVITRTWTATDDCGNNTSCDQVITVEDTTVPMITCPADATVECDDDTSPTGTGSATASDACIAPSLAYSDDLSTNNENGGSGGWPAEGPWVENDPAGGNTGFTDGRVRINSGSIQIRNTADISRSIDLSGAASATISFTYQRQNEDWESGDQAFLEYFDGTNWVATSWSINGGAIDGAPLSSGTVNLPITAQQIRFRTSGNSGPERIRFDDILIMRTDPGGTINPTFTDVVMAGSCNGEEVITRTWTATDACGNSSSCNQTITVEDNTAPTITCPADVTVESGGDTSPASTGSATTSDACDPAPTVTFSDSTAMGACESGIEEVITRTWTATDACGNSTSCVQTITPLLDCCFSIDSLMLDPTICSGDVLDSLAVTTTFSNPDSIAFVYFTSAQSDSSLIYSNGIGIDTIQVMSGNDTVRITNVSIPAFTNPSPEADTVFIYAIKWPIPSDPTCRPYDEILVTVFPQPDLSTTDGDICEGLSIDLGTLVTNVNNTILVDTAYFTNLQNAIDSTAAIASTVSPTTTTEYYIRLSTNTNPSCYDIDSLMITVNDIVVSSLTTICDDNGTGGDATDDTFTITLSATNASPGSSGQYLVIYNSMVLNGSGTDYGQLVVVSHVDFVANGVFSPTLTIRDVDEVGCEAMTSVSVVNPCSVCPPEICLPIKTVIKRNNGNN